VFNLLPLRMHANRAGRVRHDFFLRRTLCIASCTRPGAPVGNAIGISPVEHPISCLRSESTVVQVDFGNFGFNPIEGYGSTNVKWGWFCFGCCFRRCVLKGNLNDFRGFFSRR
jgi:hypothetical protein